MGDTINANFVPPKYSEDFSGFIDAVWDRHGKLINKLGERRVEHIKKTYLNHDPHRLGGRAVGLPGQSGSNNSGEKKNHIIKDYLKTITRFVPNDERKNIVFAIAACGLDLYLEDDLETTFVSKPRRLKNDYDFLRHIGIQARADSGQLMMEAQYMVCTDTFDRTNVLDAREVIGNPRATCTVHPPTASLVFSEVDGIRKLQRQAASSASFFQQSFDPVGSEGSSTIDQCMNVLNSYDLQQKKQLMRVLIASVMTNVPGRKDGESWEQFIHRRLQRNPLAATTTRTVSRLKKKKNNIRKNKKPSKKELAARAKKDAEKFGDPGKTLEYSLSINVLDLNYAYILIYIVRPRRRSARQRNRWGVWLYGRG